MLRVADKTWGAQGTSRILHLGLNGLTDNGVRQLTVWATEDLTFRGNRD
jgi:hypothetical protein